MGRLFSVLALLLSAGCHVRRPGEARRFLVSANQRKEFSTDTQAGPVQERVVQRAAIDSIEAGDYGHARGLLDDLLLIQYLTSARDSLSAGLPADALNELDHALALSPRDVPTQMLKADASLRLAELGIAEGATGTLITGSLQDAFEYYTRVSDDEPRAVFGATRAARMLGNTEDAVEWARRGLEVLESGSPLPGNLVPLPRRSIAQAFFGAYTRARTEASALRATEEGNTGETPPSGPAGDGKIQLLFRETERSLGSLLGRASTSPWAWATLADLYEWEGRFDLALTRLSQGLERLPGDASLLQRISRIADKAPDRKQALEVLLAATRQSPDDALCHWYLGVERFRQALDRFSAGDYAPEGFRTAEANFRKCRDLQALNTEACLDYELVCRGARGWCAFYGAEDLELSMQEFLSMNELRDRGIEWAYQDRLRSGVLGLAFVGDSYNQRRDNLAASAAFEAAHHADPDDGTWANNAGFFLRDAAVEIEADGKDLARAAQGAITDETTLGKLRLLAGSDPAQAGSDVERAYFSVASEKRLKQARSLMERSWLAYERAAEAFPDDIRIVNDAALVLVYYNHTHLDVAEAMLERCVEMGEEQIPAARAALADPRLDEADRAELEARLFDLEEAWGDAHQNLGVLEWVHKGDGAAALPYLRRSVEIGPDPRPDLSNNLMPLIRGESEPVDGDLFDLAGWGQPLD